MTFDRQKLPDPITYFESENLTLKGPPKAKWLTTECRFHGGSDSMRVNRFSGAFRCMNCGAKGGDVLAYHMANSGREFIEAAKSLNAWVDTGEVFRKYKPTSFPPRAALQVLEFESTLVAIAAGNIANGVALTDVDRKRLYLCASRISRISEDYES